MKKTPAPALPTEDELPTMDLGCHLSIAKGLPAMYDQAAEVRATCAQIFTRNPRGEIGRAHV